jgi:lysophospholipase L1-like esterase
MIPMQLAQLGRFLAPVALGEVSYLYRPSSLAKSAAGSGVLDPLLGAGNGMSDVRGNVFAVSGGVLVGTLDTVDAQQYLRDQLLLPSGSTPGGANQTVVFDLATNSVASVFAMFHRASATTAYFVGATNDPASPSAGKAQLYAISAGSAVASNVGTVAGFVSGHALRVICTCEGTSPTTLRVDVYDLSAGAALISSATLTDSTAGLQTPATAALALGNSLAAATSQAARLNWVWAFDHTSTVHDKFVAFGIDSLSYGEKTTGAGTYGGTVNASGASPASVALATLGSAWGGCNLGNQAQTLTEALSLIPGELDVLARDRQVQWFACLGGTNDIGQGANAATTQTRIQAVCEAARARGWRVAVSTIPPVGAGCTIYTAATFNSVAPTVNTWLRANWSTFADALVDLAADGRMSSYSSTYYDATDQLHFNDAGSAVYAELLVDEIGP